MRRIAFFLILCFGLTGTQSSAQVKAPHSMPEISEEPQFIKNLAAKKPLTVVVFGTSLTAGGQWVKDLDAWLESRYPGQAKVINSGQGGKASNTALALLDKLVIAHKPDCVFIEFAINDASSYQPGNIDHGISPEKSVSNLNELIDRIRAANPSVEIILQTMNVPWDAPNGNRSASRRPHLADYYQGYRQVAADRNLRLIDHHKNWLELQRTDPEKFKAYIPDGVHPAAEGSTAVTFGQIERVLSQKAK